MKKILAIMMATLIVVGMAWSAMAASITITQDSTYSGTAGEPGRTYTYYQIFHATLSGSNSGTGGGYTGTSGTPGDITNSLTKGYSYYLKATDDATQIAQLGTWDAETKTWNKASGNLWFDLTPSADGTQYIVTWAAATTDSETVQKAADWLSKNYTALTYANLTWNSGTTTWTATDLEDGYYLIKGNTGKNLVAATTNLVIKEKNDYPPIDKTQADEDNATQVDTELNLAIGDKVTYQAKVTIPATAKVGDTMVVTDTPSTGLTYNGDVAVKENTGAATVVFGTAGTGDAWTATITVTDGSQGKDVIFEYTMTINENALVDTDRINTFKLKFGDNYNAIPETVPFTTYYTGIEKVDGADSGTKLAGVKFTLTEAGKAFNVKKTSGTPVDYYIPDPSGTSNVVVTDTNGLIVIRGLDNDKEYVLTETETLDGYNLLAGPKTLTLVKDTSGTYVTDSFDKVENNKGTVLPSTGGIGTTIFYIVGGLLAVGAGVVLVTKKRMSKEDV